MASVERAMAKAAAALLPGLLPTPPRSTISPCLIILPSSFAAGKPKPSRADSAERWDVHKKNRNPGSPSSSSCGSSSPWRASSVSSVERWDINKKFGRSSSTTSSSSSSSRGSSAIHGRASLCNKRAPSRTSSADRWDIHKKTRAAESDAESRTSEQELEEREINHEQPQGDEMMDSVFSGSSFFASPEPSMLPMPAFFRSRGPGMMHVPAILRVQ